MLWFPDRDDGALSRDYLDEIIMGSESSLERLRFRVQSTQDKVAAVVDRVHAFVEDQFQKEETIYRAQLLFNEAMTNALKHGNDYHADKNIQVEVEANGRTFAFSVEDEGAGFEPDDVENPLNGTNMMRAHGRGLHIIEELADEVAYERDGRRLRVTVYP